MSGHPQLSGLASGLDTAAIIGQLMSVERIPRARIERQQGAAQARIDALRDIATKLRALKTATTELQSAGLWTPKQTITSSDSTKVGVLQTAPVAAGTYAVEVQNLANRAERSLVTRERPNASSLTITGSNGTQYVVDVPANATVDQLVGLINGSTGLPVSALNRNGELLLQASATGAPGNFTVAGAAIDVESSAVTGVDATFTVGGTSYTSSNNVSTTAIPGLELKLGGVTTAPIQVAVTEAAVDRDAIAGKLKAFVESYNAVVDTIRSKTAEKKVPNAATIVDAKRGVLFGDPGLSRTLSQLRIGVMEPVSVGNTAAIDELAEIGVSTGAASAVSTEKNNGRLVFDEARFKAAWDGDKASVERLLRGAGGLKGFGQRMDDLIKPLTDVGGVFDGRLQSGTSEIARLKDGLARMDLRLERKEVFYRKQFTALETALQKMQTQGAQLASRLPQPQNDS